MYALPEENDLKALDGRTAEDVSFVSNRVFIRFDNDILISIDGTFRHQMKEGETDAAQADLGLSGSRLMRMLEHSIENVQGRHDGTLILTFMNGDVLTIDGDTGPYASYHTEKGLATDGHGFTRIKTKGQCAFIRRLGLDPSTAGHPIA